MIQAVLASLRSGARTLDGLVQDMGPFLTDTDGAVRRRATALLAIVVEDLARDVSDSSFFSKQDKTRVLCSFFGARLGDYVSIASCLRALRALLGFASGRPTPESRLACLPVCKAVFNELHVAALDQKLRQSVYELLLFLITDPVHAAALTTRVDGADTPFALNLALFFVQSVAGERDPRNLTVALRVAERLLSPAPPTRLGDLVASLSKEIFDVVSVYFPITFRPPPNDPYGITREQLVGALRDVFAASDALAPLVLPLLLEKLASSVADAKRDAMQTLERCLPKFAAGPGLSPRLAEIASALEREVLQHHDLGEEGGGGRAVSPWTAPVAGRGIGASVSAIGLNFSGSGHEDASGVGLYSPPRPGTSAAELAELPVTEVALHTVAALTRVLSQRVVQGAAPAASADWDAGVGRLVRSACAEVRRGADSLAGRGSARLLCAVASASHHALTHVLAAAVPIALDRLTEAHEHHRWGVRSAIVALLAGLTHAVDPAVDYAPGAHPLSPYLPDLLARLMAELRGTGWPLEVPGSDRRISGASGAPPPEVVIRGSVARSTAAAAICDIVIRPPSLLLSSDETTILARRLAALLLSETDRRVCDAVLRALCMMGTCVERVAQRAVCTPSPYHRVACSICASARLPRRPCRGRPDAHRSRARRVPRRRCAGRCCGRR